MNIFAAIDLETSGLDMEKCDIIGIAIVPLNQDFTVSKDVPEFTAQVKAEHPETAEAEAMQVNRLNPDKGESCKKVTADIRQWIADNGIESITPVEQNLDFDLKFIAKGFPELSRLIRRHGRDSMRLALAINDLSVMETGEPRFEKVSLSALKDALNITGEVQHNAFEDAKDAALVYRKLLNLITLK